MPDSARFDPPEEPPPRRRDRRAAADARPRDARRDDLTYGCVDWFEYPEPAGGLPMLEITRLETQPVARDEDERTEANDD